MRDKVDWRWVAFFAFLTALVVVTWPFKAKAEVIDKPYFGEANFCATKQDRIDSNSEEMWNQYLNEHRCFSQRLPYVLTHIVQAVEDDGLYFLVEIQVEVKGRWYQAYAIFDQAPMSGGQLTALKVHDPQHPEWDKWFSMAPVTEEAYPRLAAAGHVWKTCCGKGDRVKTQFRVNKINGADEWWYLDPTTGQWMKIENDIIHWEDDPTMPAQLKVEGVLFVYNGLPTCFWPSQEGG